MKTPHPWEQYLTAQNAYMMHTRLRWVSGMQVRTHGWRFSFRNRKAGPCNADAWAVDMRRLKREKRRAKQRRNA